MTPSMRRRYGRNPPVVQSGDTKQFRRLLVYPRRQCKWLALILGLNLISSAAITVQPWPLKILVDYALGDVQPPASLIRLVGLLSPSVTVVTLVVVAALASLLIFIVSGVVSYWSAWAWARAGQRMVFDLATDLFGRYQRLSLSFHRRHPVGDALDRLSGDTYAIYDATRLLLVTPIEKVITIAAVGLVAWNLDARLTLLSFAAAPLMAGFAIWLGPRLRSRERRRREARSRITTFVHQTLTAIPVVQSFGAERQNAATYSELADDLVAVSQRNRLAHSLFEMSNAVAVAVGTAVILLIGGLEVVSRSLPLGTLLVFLAYLRSLYAALRELFGTYGTLQSARAGLERVVQILESPAEVPQAAEPVVADRSKGHVAFHGVSYGFEPGRLVLEDITLEVRPGEMIALVGKTGAGKSALVSLIPRFDDPVSGYITLDGIDIRRLDIESLRSQISVLFQEPFLLPTTVAENIRLARRGASQADVEEAARRAGADSFIRALPDGYETSIGELGATLSGGEKQRLAIARAILKDAPILILDEPTSALDAETERSLMEDLNKLCEDRSTILIAHRISSIRHADRIVVIDGCRVAEQGTHEALIRQDGLYRKLWSISEGVEVLT